MGLVHCPDCNRMISDRALMCPECGYSEHADNVIFSHSEKSSRTGTIRVCKKCKHEYDPQIYTLFSPWYSTLIGGAMGFVLGGSIGIAAGPFGAISGAVPLAVVGAYLGYSLSAKISRCPECRKIEKT